jgi:hypothetical protein
MPSLSFTRRETSGRSSVAFLCEVRTEMTLHGLTATIRCAESGHHICEYRHVLS